MAVEAEGSPGNWVDTQALDLKERAPIHTCWERDPLVVLGPLSSAHASNSTHTHPSCCVSPEPLSIHPDSASCLERPITDILGNLLSHPLDTGRGQPTAVKSHIVREHVIVPADDKEEGCGGV